MVFDGQGWPGAPKALGSSGMWLTDVLPLLLGPAAVALLAGALRALDPVGQRRRRLLRDFEITAGVERESTAFAAADEALRADIAERHRTAYSDFTMRMWRTTLSACGFGLALSVSVIALDIAGVQVDRQLDWLFTSVVALVLVLAIASAVTYLRSVKRDIEDRPPRPRPRTTPGEPGES